MNAVFLAGRMCREPVRVEGKNGKKYVRFTIAVRRNYKTNGEYVTDFIECEAWPPIAERVMRITRTQFFAISGYIETYRHINVVEDDEEEGKPRKIHGMRVKVRDLTFYGSKLQKEMEMEEMPEDKGTEYEKNGRVESGFVEVTPDDVLIPEF